MNLLFSKRTLLAVLIMCCSFSFAQQKIDIKYFVNSTQFPIENVRIYLVTKSDTITPKIEKGKIQLSSKMEQNFSAFAIIDGKTIAIGSYRPAVFNEIDAIIIGRINDFSQLKKHWEKKDSYFIDNEYLIEIPDSAKIKDVIYAAVKNDVNDSGISNYIKYKPKFTISYEVIQSKN